jgi:hypothetical protein
VGWLIFFGGLRLDDRKEIFRGFSRCVGWETGGLPPIFATRRRLRENKSFPGQRPLCVVTADWLCQAVSLWTIGGTLLSRISAAKNLAGFDFSSLSEFSEPFAFLFRVGCRAIHSFSEACDMSHKKAIVETSSLRNPLITGRRHR